MGISNFNLLSYLVSQNTVKFCYLEQDGTVLKLPKYPSIQDIEGKIPKILVVGTCKSLRLIHCIRDISV